MKQYFCGVGGLINLSLAADISTEIVNTDFHIEDIREEGCLSYDTDKRKSLGQEYAISDVRMFPLKETWPITKDITSYYFSISILYQKKCKEPCCPENRGYPSRYGETEGAMHITSKYKKNEVTLIPANPLEKGQPLLNPNTKVELISSSPNQHNIITTTTHGGEAGQSVKDTINEFSWGGKYSTAERIFDEIFKYAINGYGLYAENVKPLEDKLNGLAERFADEIYRNLDCNMANKFCDDCTSNQINVNSISMADPAYVSPAVREARMNPANRGATIKLVSGNDRPNLYLKYLNLTKRI